MEGNGRAVPATALALGILAASVLLCGCLLQSPNAPLAVYSGPERPQEKVAVVECGFSTRILAIDGDPGFQGKAMRDRFALLPGEHRFTVTLAAETVGEAPSGQRPRTVTFTLEAGHTYDISIFNQPVNGREWGVVVTDRTTHREIINPFRTL